MASMGMLGAGLSAIGDTLSKYAMQRMSGEEALAREKALADYKIEMQDKMEARAAETYAKKVGLAREAAAQSLKGRIDEATGRPGMLSELTGLQSQYESAVKDTAGRPNTAPIVRSGEVTTETALQDLSAADRGIYKRNIEEGITYLNSLAPSESEINAETIKQLIRTDPKAAKSMLDELKTKAEIDNLYRPKAQGAAKVFSNEKTGEVLMVSDKGEMQVLRPGTPQSPKAAKKKELTPTQVSNNAEIQLARKQVREWQEAHPKATSYPTEIDKLINKARQRMVGDDPQFDAFSKHFGEGLTQKQLQAVSQGAPATSAKPVQSTTPAKSDGKPWTKY